MTEADPPLQLDDLFRTKRKVAFKALGGRAKAVYWHLGVARALESLGYKFVGGVRKPDEPRLYGPFHINPVIGSSAGALFAAMVARYGGPIERLMEIEAGEEAIFHRAGVNLVDYYRRVKHHTEFRTGRPFRLADLHLIDLFAFKARYTVDGLEKFVREGILRGVNRFQDLAAEMYVMVTELDHPRTLVAGEKESEQTYDYLYVKGVPISEAAAASMALPPIFAPYPLTIKGQKVPCIDGELRDPFNTNVAEESGADLVFISSVYQPYQYTEEFGSSFESGLLGIYPQSRDQSLDAKMLSAIHTRRKIQRAFDAMEKFLERTMPLAQRAALLRILQEKLDYRPSNTLIYIKPHQDMDLYRIDPFDLSERTKRIVMHKGYERTFRVLEEYGYLKPHTPVTLIPAPPSDTLPAQETRP